ncbi:MAG: DNA primase, partial [Alistipes sp.]|nr:DNA primase [Alistipes sp.]
DLRKRNEVHVEDAAEMHAVGVPKAVALYKTKVIEGLIKECQARLGEEGLTDGQEDEIMQRMAALNRAKVTMAKKLQRLIL